MGDHRVLTCYLETHHRTLCSVVARPGARQWEERDSSPLRTAPRWQETLQLNSFDFFLLSFMNNKSCMLCIFETETERK